MMRKIIYLVFISVYGICFSQNGTLNETKTDTKLDHIDIKPPGITDFMRYGNMSSPSYTGSLEYSIPLISERDINISIGYESSGFRPNKRSGLVGLNWFLNVGGAITREVNGMPDDQKGEPHVNGAPKETNGFIVGVRNRTHQSEDAFNMNDNCSFLSLNKTRYLLGTDPQSAYEGDPDIFNFNFNGMSGKFFMGNDGEIKVLSTEPNYFKIDISSMPNQEYVNVLCKPSPSEIRIIDKYGNKYFFGGLLKNLEYTLTIGDNNKDSSHFPIITTWHLYKIEYANGRITEFKYRDDSGLIERFADYEIAIHNAFPNYNGNNPSLRDFIVLNEYYSEESLVSASVIGVTPAPGSYGLKSTLLKTSILEQIISDTSIIDFTYSRQAHKFNTRNPVNDLFYNQSYYSSFIDLKLDKIRLYNNKGNAITGDLIKTIDFNYTYYGGSIHSRMFLTSLKESNKDNPYLFEYYNTNLTFPKPITFGIDHWGFWNGKGDTTNNLIPYQNYQSNGDYTECTSSICTTRNPSFTFALAGMLKKVVYPTKGRTEFEYEPHDYSKRLEVKSINNYKQELYEINGISGGTRIKTIIDYDLDAIVTSKKSYEYKKNSSLSSGILLEWPRYTIAFTVDAGFSTPSYMGRYQNNPIGRHIMDKSPIVYSKVSEIITGKGRKEITYATLESNPDIDDSMYSSNGLGNYYPYGLALQYNNNFFNDKSVERGKVKLEEIFDESGQLKQKTIFTYNENPNRFLYYTTKFHLTGPSIQSNKLYLYNDYLSKKESITYTSSGQISQVNEYYYENPSIADLNYSINALLSKEKSFSSKGSSESTYYNYPYHSSLSNEPNINQLISKNIIGTPLKIIKNNDTETLYSQKTEFGVFNGLLLPSTYYNSKVSTIIEKKITYNSYDDKGNITQYTPEGAIPTAVIWGYNKTLPIAKIENATYAQVQQYVATLQSASNNDTLTQSSFSTLRNALPNAMITTYTHKPLVGISTIVDPKGNQTTYTYDSFNRLKEVKDHQNNVLKEHSYNYRP